MNSLYISGVISNLAPLSYYKEIYNSDVTETVIKDIKQNYLVEFIWKSFSLRFLLIRNLVIKALSWRSEEFGPCESC